MHEWRISGSYYDIGKQIGSLIKGHFTPPPASEKKLELAKKCEKHVSRYAPGIIEELRGLSEAAEIDYELMKAFELTLGIEPQCSVFAVSGKHTSDGIPIFARNYDWDESFQNLFTCTITKPKDGLKHVSFTDCFVSRYGGVNEEGLAVAITAIPAYIGNPVPGVRMNIATRWILDTCRTTEEATSYLKEIPHVYAHNFLIADRSGNIARVETAGEKTFVDKIKEGFGLTTNHFQSYEMKSLESEDFPLGNSLRRFNNMINWFDKREDTIQLDDVKYVLSDHDKGVCDHQTLRGVKFGTIWSWIALLGKRQVYVCDGSPCKNEYTKIEF